MAPYIDGKDIDTFLDTFEATMRIHRVDEDDCRLNDSSCYYRERPEKLANKLIMTLMTTDM